VTRDHAQVATLRGRALFDHLPVGVGRGCLVRVHHVDVDRDRYLSGGDLVSDGCVADHHVCDLRQTETSELRDVELEHDPPEILAIGVAEVQVEPSLHRCGGILVQDPEKLDLLRRPDLDAHVLRYERG